MSSSYLEKNLQAKHRGWQRRHQRFRADFPLKATVLREQGYLDIQGRCGDIARGGMGAVLTEEAAKGEVLTLECQLAPSAEPLIVRAIVRYRKGFVHGLEFLGLTAEQQARIDAFCAASAPIG